MRERPVMVRTKVEAMPISQPNLAKASQTALLGLVPAWRNWQTR